MITIQMKLKDIIEKIMIPESKTFLNELDEMINNNISTDDDLEAKKDMEYFYKNFKLSIFLNKLKKITLITKK
ncbi:hypothetical protein N5U20_04330 [Aliarcobacter butzleri]|uniref:hypothetical protein n=1 Tax=Aliarcobacter TaxID=2321111 RepID=UPI0021B1817D|nr:hypothetical protein [Aliarcobacter butzleri]MCT7612432.1 hypothetical protein [Aliarcobacter butzleri]MCT7641074.1 hypothetical protein [Aliarcobacter butzleri]